MRVFRPKTKPHLFHHEIKWILVTAQFFGLLPVRGVTSENYKNLNFTWMSKRAFLSIIIIIGSLYSTCMIFYRLITKGFTLNRFSGLVFNTNATISGLIFLRLAKRWPKIMKIWSETELHLEYYHKNKSLKKKFGVVMFVIMVAATIEHILSTIPDSYQLSSNNEVKQYFIVNYPYIFDYFQYSLPIAIYETAMNACNVFAWNFQDVFLIIMSISLTQKFQQITEEVRVAYHTKNNLKSHWMKLREDYNDISTLCRKVNKRISPLILLSFGTNMYFIMAQLYWSLKHRATTIETIYFSFSFALLLSRTVVVTLFGSYVYDESTKPLSYLLAIKTDCYNSEVERFSYQIHCLPIALTGDDFFTITRGLLFGMAGTIVTYELFLLQSNIVYDI